MAAATCTAAGLISAGSCFTDANFGDHRQKALLAWLWWQIADSATNTATTQAEQLNQATCLTSGLNKDQFESAQIGILNRGFTAATGIVFSIDILTLTGATAATAISCFMNVSDAQLESIVLYNQCRFFGSIV